MSNALIPLGDDIDVTVWINEALVSVDKAALRSQSLSDLDQKVTLLTASLELASQEAAAQLDQTVENVSRGIPRLGYDLHVMNDSALSLRKVLGAVHDSSGGSVPQEVTLALDRLRYLDTVKRGMEQTREVMREAESWSSLEMEVTSLLSEQSYEKAAERLSEASKSMAVFENTPEYESRRALMVSLQNQLEASLSSALVAAINTQDVALCRQFFSIFVNIQRESEFRNYYNGSRKAPLVELWQTSEVAEGSSGTPADNAKAQKFVDFLRSFYAQFLAMLTQESPAISFIFPNPGITLSTLISSTVSALQPSVSERLSLLFDHYGPSALDEVISALKATQDFASGVKKVLESMAPSTVVTLRGADGTESQKLHSRRSSMRMSVSWRPGTRRSAGLSQSNSYFPAALEWEQDLFQSFLEFQVDYRSLEGRYVEYSLRAIQDGDRSSGFDGPRQLRESSGKVFSVLQQCIARCQDFTNGYGAVGLLQVVDNAITSYLESWLSIIKAGPNPSSSAIIKHSEEDLSDLDYTASDWTNIQSTLNYLSSAKVFSERMLAFQAKLRTYLRDVAAALTTDNEVSPGMLSGVAAGFSALLAQSTLNSLDLHQLLGARDPDVPDTEDLPGPPPNIVRQIQYSSRASGGPIIIKSQKAVSTFAETCQIKVQDIILAPTYKYLASYPLLPVWESTEDGKARTGFSGEISIPVFSLSPNDVVRRITESLLNLPRLFEVYADDDSLSFSLETLPHFDTLNMKLGVDHLTPGGEVGAASPGHRRRSSVASLPLSPETISAAWLSSLGYSVLSHLARDILPSIRRLTPKGAAQLSTDLAYLSNIVRALNVEHEEIERWKELVDLEEDECRKRASESEKSKHIFKVISKIRGWSSG